MATRKELNDFYKKIYNKDFPSSTLSKWKKEGKIRVVELSKELKKGASQYDYNLEDFKKIVCSEDYQKRIKASKENPKDYIGKQCGYLLIKGIVPKEEKKDKKYIGTVMYCQCLRCNRPDLVQVRFSYLTPNGNYKQETCGCGRKEKAFLSSTRKDISEEFLKKYQNNFDYYLYIHRLLNSTTDKYYSSCDIKEYEEAINYFYNDKQLKAVYQFWQKQNKTDTFYDWSKPSLDHIIPKSKGGTNKISNLQVLTVFENLSKRDMTMDEWNNFKKETNTKSDYFIENILQEGREG